MVKLEEAILKPKNYSLEKDGITQSLISNFMSCRVKGMLSLNRWSNGSKNKTVNFGSLVHHILENVYGVKKIPDMPAIEKMIDAFETKVKPEQKEHDNALASAIIEGYLEYYKDELKTLKFVRTEGEIDVIVDGVRRRGKIDAECIDKLKRNWLMETKTKGQIQEDSMMKIMAFDFQNLFYLTNYEYQTGKKVRGTYYNVIRKPQHKIKAGESLREFKDRLLEIIRKDPGHFYKRYEIVYTNMDKEKHINNCKGKLDDIKSWINDPDKIYRNEFSCKQGNFECEYLDACSTGNMGGYTRTKKLFEELS